MVKHIILWKLKEDLNGKGKQEVLAGIKESLEGLAGKVPGLLNISVETVPLPSSNADVMLYSELEDEKALKEYQVHPAHVNAADNFVRPYTETRMCMDFEV